MNPARSGHVQITRGCGRGCQFCTPTMRRWVSIPKSVVLKEIEVNVRGGIHGINFITDDGLRYGSRGLEVDREAVLDLYRSALAMGADSVSVAHISFQTVLQAPDLVREISELCGYSARRPYLGPQIGLETGSPRLVEKYMRGKPRPYRPEEWPEVVVQATGVLNDNHWYPCTTLIMGLPGETEDDVLRTLELVDRLKGSKQWLFPLLFVAMGGSVLEREETFTLERMTQPHWDLLFECWEHDLRFTREVADVLFSSVRNTIARRVLRTFVERSIPVAERYIAEARRDPEAMVRALSGVRLESALDLVRCILPW